MSLQAITGQLYIDNGSTRNATAVPGLLALPAPARAARGREKDFLFVHLTLSGQPDETAVVSQDLLDAVSNRFFHTSGSITAALRQAVMEANQLLLRLNMSGTQTTREGAITCAALRQGELYTLQVGESRALIGRNFGIERLPAGKVDRITPLGRSSGIDIRYYHHRLQDGDTLLLLDPRLGHISSETFQPALVDVDMADALNVLQAVVSDDSARLLLVEFVDDMPLNLPEAAQPMRQANGRSPINPQPRRESPHLPSIPISERLPQPIRDGIKTEQLAADVERTARQATSRAFFGLSWFADLMADALEKLRPQPSPEALAEDAAQIGWAIPALMAIIIPILIGSVVAGVYIQRGQGQQLAALKQEMALDLGLADQTDDENAQRDYYQNVLALAYQVETQIRPGDGDVQRYRQSAQSALDALDDITRLEARLLFELPQDVQLTAVALQDEPGGDLFTLDSNGNIYQNRIDENYAISAPTPELVLLPDQAVGNHVVGRIVDIMWRPEGSEVARSGLAALDANGALLTYHPNFDDTLAAALPLSSEWQQPLAMSTYNERLYILDPLAQQIWKYFPTGEQFDVTADDRTLSFAESPDLGAAVDFDLYEENGSLVIAYADGRLRYYDTRNQRRQWDETTMQQLGQSFVPIVSPTAVKFIGEGLFTSVFVADTGTGRILQLNTRAGQVLAQYKVTDGDGRELFADLSDFTVTSDFGAFFFVVDNKLYVATEN